jgi:hypothetical protein
MEIILVPLIKFEFIFIAVFIDVNVNNQLSFFKTFDESRVEFSERKIVVKNEIHPAQFYEKQHNRKCYDSLYLNQVKYLSF